LEADIEDCHLSMSDGSFENFVKEQGDIFVSKFYAKPSLPRNIVQNIIDETHSFISGGVIMNTLKTKVLDALRNSQAPPSAMDEISDVFSVVEQPFTHLRTEHLRLKHFQTLGNYIPPQEFEIGKREENVKTKVGVKQKWVAVMAQHVPIIPVLTKFLEMPDALDCILKYMDLLASQSDSISNLVQGESWKKKDLSSKRMISSFLSTFTTVLSKQTIRSGPTASPSEAFTYRLGVYHLKSRHV